MPIPTVQLAGQSLVLQSLFPEESLRPNSGAGYELEAGPQHWSAVHEGVRPSGAPCCSFLPSLGWCMPRPLPGVRNTAVARPHS